MGQPPAAQGGQVLHRLPFTSERKIMSVLVKLGQPELPGTQISGDGSSPHGIRLLTKGAAEIVLDRCKDQV
jgi:magnesium-transporting ATPase (P-type)